MTNADFGVKILFENSVIEFFTDIPIENRSLQTVVQWNQSKRLILKVLYACPFCRAFSSTGSLIHKHVKFEWRQVDFGNHLSTQTCQNSLTSSNCLASIHSA